MEPIIPPTIPRPRREVLDEGIRDFLIDLAHGHRTIPELTFAPLQGGRWARHSLDGYSGTLSRNGAALRLLVDAEDRAFNNLYDMMGLRNQPVKLTLQDGSSVHAELGHMKSLGPHADIRLHHWTWTTPVPPLIWAGRLEGKVPSFGNLSLSERGEKWFKSKHDGFRLLGKYNWYVLPQTEHDTAIVVIDAAGESLDRKALAGDFYVLQFTFGGGLRLDCLTGFDGARNVAGAMSLGGFERPHTTYRPPVAHRLDEAQIWLPEFFRLVASKISMQGLEPVVIAIAAYLDSEADHLDGAYLKAQVGLEAFAKRIVTESSPDLLVKDDAGWKRWVSTLEPLIRSQVLDPKQVDVIKGKFISAMYASSGDVVRKALSASGIEIPKDVREEIKKRNYPAHGFLMNKTIDHELDEDVRRLELIQTLIVALVATYAGYAGPIHGYDVADDGGRLAPTWWPVRSRQEDVWVRFFGERLVAGPNPNIQRDPIVETNAPFEAAVRERAYFLWHNRTGAAWWDPVSNWFEAARTELERTD